MKVLIDMNLPPRLANILVERGVDAKHWYALGSSCASDFEIMEYARSNNCIVLTHDLDFSAILSTAKSNKPSVMQLRAQHINIDEIAKIVHAALKQCENELKAGAILTLDSKKVRLRILPL